MGFFASFEGDPAPPLPLPHTQKVSASSLIPVLRFFSLVDAHYHPPTSKKQCNVQAASFNHIACEMGNSANSFKIDSRQHSFFFFGLAAF